MSQKQVQAPAQSTAETSTELSAPNKSNAQAAQDMEKPKSAGLANYQAALGTWLGGELYKAVGNQLSLDKISDVVDDGMESAIKSLVGMLKEGGDTDAAVEAFAQALADTYGGLAGEWVDANGQDLVASLNGWVDAHPRTILTVALLAAAGAVLADLDIPELKQKFKLGDLSAEVSAKLGSLQNIGLEQIRSKLEYVSGPLIAAVEVGYKQDGGVEGTLSGGYGSETRRVDAEVSVTEEGLDAWSAEGLYQLSEGKSLTGGVSGQGTDKPTFEAAIKRQDGSVTRTESASYDMSSGLLSLKHSELHELQGGGSMESSVSGNSRGERGLGLKYKSGPGELQGSMSFESVLKQNDNYQLTDEQKLGFGLDYNKDDLKAHLDAAFSSAGDSSLAGKFSDKAGDHSYGADFKLRLNDPELEQLGAFYNYKDSDSFQGFMADYRYKAASDSHKLKLSYQDQFGEIKARLRQEFDYTGGQLNSETSAMGAWKANKDLSILGGVRYKADQDGGRFIPELGAQVKGVPLTIQYDPKKKSVGVGITIPF